MIIALAPLATYEEPVDFRRGGGRPSFTSARTGDSALALRLLEGYVAGVVPRPATQIAD
jgi:hypothetical protein